MLRNFLNHLILNFQFFIVTLISAETTMIITWGKPTSLSNSSTTPPQTLPLSWEDCVEYCRSDPTCILVYDTFPCEIYTFGQLRSVSKLSSESGERVAFRTTGVEDGEEECPIEQKSPLLMDGVIKEPSYSITLENNVWTFKYCPTQEFQLFTRVKGDWCIAVLNKNVTTDWPASVSECNTTYNGVLSGLENTNELNYIHSIAKSYMPLFPTRTKLGFWVNGYRRDNCMSPAKKSPSCDGTNEFYFTDPTMSRTDGYVWYTKQPDGMLNYTTNSNCICLREDGVTGAMDDTACQGKDVTTSKVGYVGFVCGTVPV